MSVTVESQFSIVKSWLEGAGKNLNYVMPDMNYSFEGVDGAKEAFIKILQSVVELNNGTVEEPVQKERKKYGKLQKFKNLTFPTYDMNLNNCENIYYDVINYLPGKDIEQYFMKGIFNYDESLKEQLWHELLFSSKGMWQKKWRKGGKGPKSHYCEPLEGRRRYYWPPTGELVTLSKISEYSGVEYNLLKYRVITRGQHHLLSLEIPSKED